MRWAVALAMSMTLGAATVPDLAELNRMIARFAPAELKVNTSALSAGDKQALGKLIQAARVIDSLFLTQRWSGNAALRVQLRKDASALGKARRQAIQVQCMSNLRSIGQAMQMYSSGASVRQIRAAIEQKYAGQYQNHTPTPPAPAPAGTK